MYVSIIVELFSFPLYSTNLSVWLFIHYIGTQLCTSVRVLRIVCTWKVHNGLRRPLTSQSSHRSYSPSAHINTQVISGPHTLLINITRRRYWEGTAPESDNGREQDRERESANVRAQEKRGEEGLAEQARHPHYHIISEREWKETDAGEMRETESWRRLNLHWRGVSGAQS